MTRQQPEPYGCALIVLAATLYLSLLLLSLTR